MKTILENTDLLVAWLKIPSACRAYLLEQKERALHINFTTVDGYHFVNETRCYVRALIDAEIIDNRDGMVIYNIVTGTGDENE